MGVQVQGRALQRMLERRLEEAWAVKQGQVGLLVREKLAAAAWASVLQGPLHMQGAVNEAGCDMWTGAQPSMCLVSGMLAYILTLDEWSMPICALALEVADLLGAGRRCLVCMQTSMSTFREDGIESMLDSLGYGRLLDAGLCDLPLNAHT